MSYIVPDKIPSYCAECDWSICLYPNVYCKRVHKTSELLMATEKRPDFCPLIEVPPHGRLIAEKTITEIRYHDADGYHIVNGEQLCELEIDADTVIEAEGET